MAAAQEGPESLRERARRALLDNPDPALPVVTHPGAALAAEPSSTSEQLEQRLKAIQLVRDLEPRRACYADRVKELSRSLTQLPDHSVHFRTVLDRLREAHSEWQVLEEKLQAAHYVIRSTQWLVDLLADPFGSDREVAGSEG
ncbi:MAG TPA: hypothetical protein VD969_21095 [Symbiobacteriaceae bacterium]|nr:hypothetical protein [Symbiobacteriaceae bacterium]